ncbi:MAG TPA: molybdopterin converting factor, partial [Actinomycetota bacterium]|nr:molybdopterin converting factor [Actinomycetota bacterium]
MNVTVRMFGALAEWAGRDRGELQLPDGATAGDALASVLAVTSQAAPVAGRVSVAVNLEVVP